jgi:hypothetical protein
MIAEKARPQQQQKIATPSNWKVAVFASNKLYAYFARTPELEAGLEQFVTDKLKQLRNTVKSGQQVLPKSLNLGSFDRGRFHDERLKHLDHYHINSPSGKLYVLVYWQQIDPQTRIVGLKLVAIIDHKQYDSSAMQKSLGKSLSAVQYSPIGVLETKKLFGWLKG